MLECVDVTVIIIHKILSRATTWWCSRRRDSLCGGSAARTSPTSPMVLISRVSDEAVVWQQLMMMNYDRCRRHPDRRLTRKQVSRGRVRQWRQSAGRVRVPSCQGNNHSHHYSIPRFRNEKYFNPLFSRCRDAAAWRSLARATWWPSPRTTITSSSSTPST